MLTLPPFLSTTWGLILAVISAIVAIWGLYKIAEGVRDIYVQTFPEIHVTGSEPTDPFLLPFSVKNQSGWFALKEIRWSCKWNMVLSRAQHATAQAIENESIKKAEGVELFIGSNLNGREYSATFEGKIVAYEISLESFEHIKRAVLTLIAAFRPAEWTSQWRQE